MEARELFEHAIHEHGADPDRTRRDAGLRDLLGAVDRRRRRRVTIRVATGLVIAIALGLGLRTGLGSTPARTQTPDEPDVLARFTLRTRTDAEHRLATASRPSPNVRVIRDRPLADLLRLDDAELASWLNAAGRPSGIVRIGRQVFVTDPATE